MLVRGFQKSIDCILEVHGQTSTSHDPREFKFPESDIEKHVCREDMGTPKFLIEGFLEGAKKAGAVLDTSTSGFFECVAKDMARILTDAGMGRGWTRMSALSGVSEGVDFVALCGRDVDSVMVRKLAKAMESLVTDGTKLWRVNLEAYCRGLEGAVNLMNEIEDESNRVLED